MASARDGRATRAAGAAAVGSSVLCHGTWGTQAPSWAVVFSWRVPWTAQRSGLKGVLRAVWGIAVGEGHTGVPGDHAMAVERVQGVANPAPRVHGRIEVVVRGHG